MDLKYKTAIVTGGCSGLGYETVSALIDQGVKVAILDINSEYGNAMFNEYKGKALYQNVDVYNAESAEKAINAVMDYWGALHICVNCAGIAPAERILHRDGSAMPLTHFQKTIEINLIGTFNDIV